MKRIISLFLVLISLSVQSQNLTLIAAGDVLLHKKLQRFGMQQGFTKIWQQVISDIQSVDIAYANLEGPIAKNLLRTGREASPGVSIDKIYTSFPMFNYPTQIERGFKTNRL